MATAYRRALRLARTLVSLAPSAYVTWVTPEWDESDVLEVYSQEWYGSSAFYYPAPAEDAAMLRYLYEHGTFLGAAHFDEGCEWCTESRMLFMVDGVPVRYEYVYSHCDPRDEDE